MERSARERGVSPSRRHICAKGHHKLADLNGDTTSALVTAPPNTPVECLHDATSLALPTPRPPRSYCFPRSRSLALRKMSAHPRTDNLLHKMSDRLQNQSLCYTKLCPSLILRSCTRKATHGCVMCETSLPLALSQRPATPNASLRTLQTTSLVLPRCSSIRCLRGLLDGPLIRTRRTNPTLVFFWPHAKP